MSLFFSLGAKRALFFALCKLNLTKSAQRYNKNFTYASIRVFFLQKKRFYRWIYGLRVTGYGLRVTVHAHRHHLELHPRNETNLTAKREKNQKRNTMQGQLILF